MGVVIRGNSGCFMAGCNTRIDHAFDVLMAKNIALKHGLELAQFIGCNHVIMNLDCMKIIETMKNGAINLDDCYHLACDFIKIQFEHVSREAYSVAHELAKMARGSAQSTWIDDPTASILPLLLGDVTLISNE
jgi:phosphotransferase system IIA component